MSQYGNYGSNDLPNWFEKIAKGAQDFGSRFAGAYGQAQLSRLGAPRQPGFGIGTVMEPGLASGELPDMTVRSPSPLDMPRVRPDMAVKSPSPMDIPRLVAEANLKQGIVPKPPSTTTGGGGGGSSLDKVFGPLFDALEQQRRNAESRYTANVGQIQNIYGQLIGARGADINDIQDAYNNLQQAASARGAATLGAMQAREQQRQSQNQAVLQSMGVGDIGSAAMDQAAEASQVAQDVAALGQSNWAGLLGAMGATAQDIARADITGYGYRQGEDIAALQGAKEDYLQGIGQQEFELKSQQALKELEAQQAAAAAAAKAQQDAADAAAKSQQQQYETFLKYSDPLTQSLVAAADMGVLSGAQVSQATDAFNTFMGQVFTANPPSGMLQWNGASAAAAFRTSPAAEGLNTTQKNLIAEAIRQSF